MTPIQCRAGRAVIGISQEELALRSGIARKSLTLFENGRRTLMPNNLKAVRRELELAGVELIGGDREGAVVALGVSA